MNKLANEIEKIRERLDILKTFTSSEEGVTRLPFSKEGKAAALFLKNEMEKSGLKAYIDLVGNVHGILPATSGNCETTKTFLMGSHYDTVKYGGAFDGIAGVVCALQVAEKLLADYPVRKANFEIIAFNDEEGCMFGSGCLGSKALTGQVDEHYISTLTDENGISIRKWISEWGGNPDEIGTMALDLTKILGFLEIHIEQGPVLEKNEEIGLVSGIVGLIRCQVTVKGRADHAGTTPMDARKDSLLISSKLIAQLDRLAKEEGNGAVATCGFIRNYPNAMNVVSDCTEFTVDMRSLSNESVQNMYQKMDELLAFYTSEADTEYAIDMKLCQPAVNMNQDLISLLEKACANHEYGYRILPSGAAHDAMVFADKIPTAMIFVPSKDGRSHCPQEQSKYEDLAKAVDIAYDMLAEKI